MAAQISERYCGGSPIRQELLETVLKWISNGDVSGYMSKHCKDKNASELLQYFKEVIAWIDRTFITYYKEMKGLNWGKLYNKYGNNRYNSEDINEEVSRLMADLDVDKKKGIFEYVLITDKKHDDGAMISGRVFKHSDIRTKYEAQDKKCNICLDEFDIAEMEADHIKPYSKGGKSVYGNLQILCQSCNREKSNKN